MYRSYLRLFNREYFSIGNREISQRVFNSSVRRSSLLELYLSACVCESVLLLLYIIFIFAGYCKVLWPRSPASRDPRFAIINDRAHTEPQVISSKWIPVTSQHSGCLALTPTQTMRVRVCVRLRERERKNNTRFILSKQRMRFFYKRTK